MMQTIDIEAVIEDQRWSDDLGDPQQTATRCFTAVAVMEPSLNRSAAALFTNDAGMRKLNGGFRGVDKPTNVLAFPSGGDPSFIGDIALALETCRREASETGVTFSDHVSHLLVHGLLHLVGYDHETEADAARMEAMETRILASVGIADPYREELFE